MDGGTVGRALQSPHHFPTIDIPNLIIVHVYLIGTDTKGRNLFVGPSRDYGFCKSQLNELPRSDIQTKNSTHELYQSNLY